MEAKELRIGNYVYFDSDDYEIVEGIYIEHDGFSNLQDKVFVSTENLEGELIEDFKGIPLTEQWLIDFGFENDNTAEWIYRKGDLMVNIGNHWTWHYMFKTIRDIKHVHQLQNLYLALPGEDLNVQH